MRRWAISEVGGLVYMEDNKKVDDRRKEMPLEGGWPGEGG